MKTIGIATEFAAGVLPKRQRVLVVEDDALIRRINAEVLLDAGYDVNTAENGLQAWDKLRRGGYELLVTDNDMPIVSGIELIKLIHETQMGLSVIMATGTLPEEAIRRHAWLRPVITLLKPYSPAELVGTAKAVLLSAIDGLGTVGLLPNWECQPLVFGLRLT